MASITEKLKILLTNFLELAPNTVGVVISDNDGLVIYSQSKSENCNDNESSKVSIDDEVVASMTAVIEPVLTKIRNEFSSKKFGTAIFETEKYRLVNVSVGDWIHSYALSQLATLDEVFPYIYLASEKIQRILEERDSNLHLSIPKLGNITGSNIKCTDTPTDSLWGLKFILIGNSEVGKTSLVNRFVSGQFVTDFRPTIGLNVMVHSYCFLGYNIKMNIYDIGSQKFFKRVRRNYYSGSNAGLIVFSLNDRESFNAIKIWYDEMVENVGYEIPFCLVGNKSDLERKVSFQEGSLMAESLGGSYIETSALTASNVEDAFSLISYKIISKLLEENDNQK